MTLAEQKQKMIESLKLVFVPHIRGLGFSGTFPNFRRERNERLEFCAIQFNRNGGSFVLECGFAVRSELPEFFREKPFEELTYANCHPNNRNRIKPEGVTGDDFWFLYSSFVEDTEFEELAKTIASLLFEVEKFLK